MVSRMSIEGYFEVWKMYYDNVLLMAEQVKRLDD